MHRNLSLLATAIISGVTFFGAIHTKAETRFQISSSQVTADDKEIVDSLYENLKTYDVEEGSRVLEELIQQNPSNKARTKELIRGVLNFDFPIVDIPNRRDYIHKFRIKWLNYIINNKLDATPEDYLSLSENYFSVRNIVECFNISHKALNLKPSPETELKLYYINTKALLGAHKPDLASKNLDKIQAILPKLYTSEKYTRKHFKSHYISLEIIRSETDYDIGEFPAPAFEKKHVALRQYFISLAIKFAPNFDLPYGEQSQLFYYEMSNYKQALASINRAIKLNPKFFGHYATRASIFNRLDSDISAINDYNKAIQLLESKERAEGLNDLEKFKLESIKNSKAIVEESL
jgi:tetratricopeptide (TPR) repeat protein